MPAGARNSKDMAAQNFSQWMYRLGREPTQRRLAAVAAAVAVVLLARSAAELTWRLVPTPEVSAGTPVQKLQPASQSAAARPGTRIAEMHLFGEVKQVTAKAEPAPVTAPETRLNLTLRGVIASDNPKKARAIITDGNRLEKFYRPGDEVTGGAQLETIHPDRVILQRGGRFETLSLPKDRLPESERAVPASAPQGAPESAEDTSREAPDTLLGYRETLKENPQAINELLNPAPAYENGKLVGFRLRPTKNRHLLRRNGILRNDIVTSVNGIPLNDPSNSFQVLQQLTSSDAIQLTILRNGTEQNIALQLE